MDKYKFSPKNIFNIYETGMSTISTKSSKTGIVSSAEHRQNNTAVCCMPFVPPTFIFPHFAKTMVG